MSSGQALRYILDSISRLKITTDLYLSFTKMTSEQSNVRGLRPPEAEVAEIPKLLDFKTTKTRLRVFTHRSYYARPNAVFEDPPGDIAPDNETLEFVGDSVLNLAVATLITTKYREYHAFCELSDIVSLWFADSWPARGTACCRRS
jgi:hypothetical protein